MPLFICFLGYRGASEKGRLWNEGKEEEIKRSRERLAGGKRKNNRKPTDSNAVSAKSFRDKATDCHVPAEQQLHQEFSLIITSSCDNLKDLKFKM